MKRSDESESHKDGAVVLAFSREKREKEKELSQRGKSRSEKNSTESSALSMYLNHADRLDW